MSRLRLDSVPKFFLRGGFLFVHDQNTIKFRVFFGSVHRWDSDDIRFQDDIFHRGYRICGTPENIIVALRNSGISDDEIDIVLSESIGRHNYKDPITNQYSEQCALEIAFHEKMNELMRSKEVSDVRYNNLLKIIRAGEPWIVEYFLDLYNDLDLREFDNKAYRFAYELGDQEIIGMVSSIIVHKTLVEREALATRFEPIFGQSDIPGPYYKVFKNFIMNCILRRLYVL